MTRFRERQAKALAEKERKEAAAAEAEAERIRKLEEAGLGPSQEQFVEANVQQADMQGDESAEDRVGKLIAR
eukprot:1180351-Alexandrium_andersonii.AAC.1